MAAKAAGVTTVDQYVRAVPADRRDAITRVRAVINAHLPPGYEESMQFGVIAWCVPLAHFPDTHNGKPLMVCGLSSQKSYMVVYLMAVYGDPAIAKWFAAAYAKAGKKLDMGKSCVRFKTLDALPLDVIGEAVAKLPVDTYLAAYRRARPNVKPRRVRSATS